MSDLKTYLAQKYMSGPKADIILSHSTSVVDGQKKKRKKRKVEHNEDYVGGGGGGSSGAGSSSGGGLVMRDEDEWGRGNDDEDDLEGADAPGESSPSIRRRSVWSDLAVVGKGLTTIRKSTANWNTVSASSIPLRSVKVENESNGGDGTEEANEAGPSSPSRNIKPDPDAPPAPMTKRRGGLRTAAQLREEAEAAAAARTPSPPPEEQGGPGQTVHRDASGRIVDVEKLKEEERRKEAEERRKAREREEWTKGLVQRRRRDEERAREREAGETDVARYADDRSMNRELREVERWNDPAAEFLTVR